ncbi:sulfurtransferase/chromate resistance protein [Rhodoblastus sp. 17X3]|uniref:sulfurtransferase/chromate resistance protein n=1 Tax=Rhodoblastus sp. 17X3 TaxID=3047026 RepID=UPI0024B65BE2|nr:sulfurtransferase/chromate resistance protein [Rhodoblastus sp. 17X3]MDI9846435.1 sulfurtransferase/chromate resistance protein [Rhodoblastus sp. 17X3]
MSAYTTISPDKLSRLLGSPKGPTLIDTRQEAEFASDPRLIPGAVRRDAGAIPLWGRTLAGTATIVIGQRGADRSHGVAAWLRHEGVRAETLEGGHEAWAAAGLPLVPEMKLPPRDVQGRTIWVTRARPKVDRIACPWLIRRFVDPNAVFLFVPPADVLGVAETFQAAPFDVEGVFWSHRGANCVFDAMVDELGLKTEPLLRLAAIVRGADTARLDLVPEAAGLLAASLGLSRLHADDLDQLEAGLALYDAFYRWCRDAVDESHAAHAAAPGKRK